MNEATPQQQQAVATIADKLKAFGVIEQASFVFLAIGLRDLFLTFTIAGSRYQCFVGVKGNIWAYRNGQKIEGAIVKTPLLEGNHAED